MPPVAPVVLSVTFDRPSYAPGDVITVTVAYLPGYPAPAAEQLTAAVSDLATGLSGQGAAGFAVSGQDPPAADPCQVTVADTGGRAWTRISDAGGEAVFTATA